MSEYFQIINQQNHIVEKAIEVMGDEQAWK